MKKSERQESADEPDSIPVPPPADAGFGEVMAWLRARIIAASEKQVRAGRTTATRN